MPAMVVRQPYAEAIERISASISYGDNAMARAAALASLEVIEEDLLKHATYLAEAALKRMKEMQQRQPIIGHVCGKQCLLGIGLVKDRITKEPFEETGRLVYQKALRRGLARIPAGHILRMSPPIIMEPELLLKGLDTIEESIAEVEKEHGYS